MAQFFENKLKHLGFILVLSADNLQYPGQSFCQKVRGKNAHYYVKFYQSIILVVMAHNIAAFLLLEEIKIKNHAPLKKINYLEIH